MPAAGSVLLIYWAAVSVLSAAVTAIDKWKARHHRRRIRERTLFLLAAIGGALSMLLTMLLVRHKTRKARFMVGIPLLMLCHLLLIAALVWFGVLS